MSQNQREENDKKTGSHTEILSAKDLKMPPRIGVQPSVKLKLFEPEWLSARWSALDGDKRNWTPRKNVLRRSYLPDMSSNAKLLSLKNKDFLPQFNISVTKNVRREVFDFLRQNVVNISID